MTPPPDYPEGAPPLDVDQRARLEGEYERLTDEEAPPPVDREAVEREVERLRVRRFAEEQFRSESAGPIRLPEARTLTERLADPPPPIEWRIEGWMPRGTRGILTAAFKGGKTTLVGNLIRSLIDGDPFLDAAAVFPCEGRVALVDFEMSERMLDRWLADQGIVNQDRVVVIPLRGNGSAFRIVDPAVRIRWVVLLASLDVQALIVDPLRPWLDSLGLDEHREAGIALEAFDQLLRGAYIAEGLIVHHHGHTAERARGDSRLRDWPDWEWRLVREDDDPASPRYIAAYGRDVEIPESLVGYDEATRRLVLAGGSRKGAAIRSALGAVEGVLEEAGEGLSGRRIEEALASSDHSRQAVRKALAKGVADGRITATPGPHRAVLHTLSAPVRQSAPSKSASMVSSSAPPPIGGRTTRQPPGTSAPGGKRGALQPCAVCDRPDPDATYLGEPVHARCAPGGKVDPW